MADNQIDLKDGGASSRKLWFSIIIACLMFAGAIVAAKWAQFGANYPVLIGGLGGVLLSYLGGNISGKWITGNQHVRLKKAEGAAAVAKPARVAPPVPPAKPPTEPVAKPPMGFGVDSGTNG